MIQNLYWPTELLRHSLNLVLVNDLYRITAHMLESSLLPLISSKVTNEPFAPIMNKGYILSAI